MKDLLFDEFADYVERNATTNRAELRGAVRAARRTDFRGFVDAIAADAAEPGNDLLRRFGRHLFGRFATLYPVFFIGLRSAREFLLEVAPHVHESLTNLYPATDFPTLRICETGGDIRVEYRSRRDLAPLAEGLLVGCFDYFGAPATIVREPLSVPSGYGCRFVVRESAAGTESRESVTGQAGRKDDSAAERSPGASSTRKGRTRAELVMKAICTRFLALVALLTLLFTAPTVEALTFHVTNTNNAGIGSLREATLDANQSSGPDSITFALGASMAKTPSSQTRSTESD